MRFWGGRQKFCERDKIEKRRKEVRKEADEKRKKKTRGWCLCMGKKKKRQSATTCRHPMPP
jgi:hypothetical protein